MSIIQGNLASSGVQSYDIEQSLRFNDDDSAYLSWTPESAGDRKTWTFSTWVKRNNINTDQWIFSSNNGVLTPLSFTASNNLALSINSSDDFITSAVYRDTSSWYHIVLAVDTTQATASDRSKLYVNGEQVTDFSYTNYASQNEDTSTNDSCLHTIGRRDNGSNYVDMYLAETHFIDGQALTPDNFGEFDETYGHWKPIAYDGSYGTNGFYLPFKQDYSVEGFSTTLYTGNGTDGHYVGGVGFEPDLLWIKDRTTGGYNNQLFDQIRGAGVRLISDGTYAEALENGHRTFETDGFTVGTNLVTNKSGDKFVAWSWDMGDSTVENTDGSITSQVRANPTYGQSIVSYTGNYTIGATVGHGLSQAPELIIGKNRSITRGWFANTQTYTSDFTSSAMVSNTTTTHNSDTIQLDSHSATYNGSGYNYIAYCFHSVAGYSKIGSYTGTGSAGNTVTTGFKPAWVMIKRTDGASDWRIFDNLRGFGKTYLEANTSDADGTGDYLYETDTGFTITSTSGDYNASGGSYIYMAFADTREYGFWLDDSGNNNDFTINNLTESDVSLDSPTNNYATLNPLWKQSGSLSTELANGNLELNLPSGYNGTPGSRGTTTSTMVCSSGKHYFETLTTGGGGGPTYVGVTNDLTFNFGGTNYTESSFSNVNAGYQTSGKVISVAFDCDNDLVWFAINGVWTGDPVAGTGGTSYSSPMMPFITGYNDTSNRNDGIANFGQDSSFAGNKTSQGYTDANGYGDFYYEPPAGYLALCTANMEEPSVVPSEHMNVVTYTGDGSTSRDVTGIGFDTDFAWIKKRSGATNHRLTDTLRGANKQLITSSTSAEESRTNVLTAFITDGFTLGDYGEVNENGATFVAWNWKAGGTGVSNTDGSITSTVSANVDAGFSIVSWTGTGSAGTVGHSLSSAPEIVITKNRDNGGTGWITGSSYLSSASHYLSLDDTSGEFTSGNNYFNGTFPTSSVISIGNATHTNESGSDIIAYCFHSVEGYSKIGTYTGNGSTDGTFVFTGFRPKYVMIKCTDISNHNWNISDSERNGVNPTNYPLIANTTDVEQGDQWCDILSNGFKVRATSADFNGSGGTYLFIAFAEMPTKYTNAR